MRKILLVEDEILIQKSIKRLLEKHGVEVTSASTGKSAIEELLANDYDRIICDLMLQDTTGFDVLEEAKKKYRLSEIQKKFLIITAYSSPQVLEQANQYGCKILSKPFDYSQENINLLLNGDT